MIARYPPKGKNIPRAYFAYFLSLSLSVSRVVFSKYIWDSGWKRDIDRSHSLGRSNINEMGKNVHAKANECVCK